MWSLRNAAGDELKCEAQHTDAGVILRFRTSAGVLATSRPIAPSDLESWIRVWRAYYLTSGWSDGDAAGRGHRQVTPRTAATSARHHDATGATRIQTGSSVGQIVTGPILRYWSVTAADGAIISCELVRTKDGLEVRCNSVPARAQTVHSMAEGLDLSHSWRSEYQFGAALPVDIGRPKKGLLLAPRSSLPAGGNRAG